MIGACILGADTDFVALGCVLYKLFSLHARLLCQLILVTLKALAAIQVSPIRVYL